MRLLSTGSNDYGIKQYAVKTEHFDHFFTFGKERPKKIEKPRMKRFLEEFKSIYWRVAIPTAAIMENLM